jgi:hypothetical protein
MRGSKGGSKEERGFRASPPLKATKTLEEIRCT